MTRASPLFLHLFQAMFSISHNVPGGSGILGVLYIYHLASGRILGWTLGTARYHGLWLRSIYDD